MGIRGLTTFIAKYSDRYFDSYELHDTYLVIDGNNLAMQMYKWHCNCYDCFGGDYDKYAYKVVHFFKLLKDCNVIPLIVFDGGFENRKLKTIYTRVMDKVNNAKKLTSATEGSVFVFPLFIRQLFYQIVLKLKLKMVRCDFEADNEIVCIAKCLNCPVLSYDSDFYISDVLYVPFSSVEIRTICHRHPNGTKYNFIPCQLYNLEGFLKSFGGFDRSLLPLIGVLLGNDYVKINTFSGFYKNIKLTKRKYTQSRQQRRIYSVIKWLQTETYESAVQKILMRSKQKSRYYINKQICSAQEGYISKESSMLKYLNVDILAKDPEQKQLYKETSESFFISDEDADGNIDIEIETEDFDINKEEKESTIYENLPDWFLNKYRKCEFPAVFMDMIVRNKYFCIPQLENYNNTHSDHISYDIISAIHTILTSGKVEGLLFVARSKNGGIMDHVIPKSKKSLPTLNEIPKLKAVKSIDIILDVLDISPEILITLEQFPSPWRLYILGIQYWLNRANPTVSKAHLYSLILCLLFLNVIDKKVGVHRSIKKFFIYYEKHFQDANSTTIDITCDSSISDLLNTINDKECLSCIKQLVLYFHMDEKLINNYKLYDINIVDSFAQFQSCLYHLSLLNILLNNAFENVLISDYYNGTFLYNICTNFSKRSDLDNYLKILISCSNGLLQSFTKIISLISCKNECIINQNNKKRRRKKKNNKLHNEVLLHEQNDEQSEEEPAVFDPNNRFSLLQIK